jgi:hypothetical protein
MSAPPDARIQEELPAGRVLAVAAQLDLAASRLAVVAAVFPVRPVGRDRTLTRGMGAFRLGISHHAPPLAALYARRCIMRNVARPRAPRFLRCSTPPDWSRDRIGVFRPDFCEGAPMPKSSLNVSVGRT